MSARKWFACLLVVGAAAWSAATGAVEIAQEQKDKLVWVDQSLQKVVTLYRERKLDDMKKLIGEIETALSGLQSGGGATAPTDAVLAPFKARLAAAQKLALHVPAQTASLASTTPAGAPKPSATRPARGRPMPSATGVSFVRDVAPILVGKCGNCHVRGNRGDFSMANFANLMAGTQGMLTVIKPGNGETSTLVEKMASGEMPPGGNKVTDQELAVITKWINEGARYDAPDPTMSLLALVPGAGGGPGGAPVLARASGNEKVLFMRDVAPILIDNCFECHGAPVPNDNADNFGMNKFADLLRGGRDGAVVNAGNAEGSLLVRMLRGTAKAQNGEIRPRMPRNGQLEDAEIATIVTWINEGAKFDGEDPNMSIELAWRMAQAKKATHEELSASRLGAAKNNWRRANPDAASEVIETDDFVLIGDVGTARMEEVRKLAEAEKTRIVTSFKLQPGKSLLKGRLTIFVFDKGFEHKEFGRVVESRELPNSPSHWFFNYIDAYACVVAPPDKTESMAPLLAETIVGAYLDSCGSEMPRWFAVGMARNIASKMHPNNPYCKQWEDALAPAMSSGVRPDTIVTMRNLDAGSAAVSQAFVKDLMRTPAWNGLFGALLKGVRFDGAFNQAFRSAPAPLFNNWTRRGG